MKKITFFLCMLIIGFANAQNDDQNSDSDKLAFAKGSQFVNVNFAITAEKNEITSGGITDESKLFGFSITPSYAYAVSDNWFLGLGLGYSSSKTTIQLQGAPEREDTRNGFEVFPFVRYYKGIGKRLAFFVQGETRFTTIRTKIANANDQRNNIFFIGIRPGLTYMLSKNIALETSIGALGYTSNNTEDDITNVEADSNRFDFRLNSANILFGLNYYF